LPRSGKRGLFASEKAPCAKNTEQVLKSIHFPGKTGRVDFPLEQV